MNVLKLLYFLSICHYISTKIYTVTSVSDFTSTLKLVSQGDTINIASGTYKDAIFDIKTNNLIL